MTQEAEKTEEKEQENPNPEAEAFLAKQSTTGQTKELRVRAVNSYCMYIYIYIYCMNYKNHKVHEKHL